VDNLREVTRLNLTLELVSACAGLVDAEAAIRLVGERLRWLFDFDTCELALLLGSGPLRWLAMRSGDEGLAATPDELTGRCRTGAAIAIASGAPYASGPPMLAICYPLGKPERPLGALCIEGALGYTHRDLRFLHHVCAGLGAALLRIEQSEQLDATRGLAASRDRAGFEEARAANEAKDTFLAMLGHELRNPLAPIIAAAELLRRGASGAALASIDIVERQARQLDRLVDDLLDVSRVTTGKVNLRRTATDLREVVSKAAEMARPRMLAKGQRLTMTVPDTPVLVDGDEARLAQVASNLLNNASAYSPQGAPVELVVGHGSEAAFLDVRDVGIGIPPDMLDSIFTMFVQGGRSKEWAPGGLGLGLGVSRALVELHGGSITAMSGGEGLGSVFRVVLPRLLTVPPASASAAPRSGGPASREGAGMPRRILLVDDNVDAADSIGTLLRVFGHEVLIAYGPDEALAAAAAFAPQVAILDIGLHIMDGYELAQELRKRLGAGAPAMIALSGYGQESDRKRSLERGFALHLVKPASLDELLDSVQAACAAQV
jgi:signal transduction histidine kinase/ActR/RegA family two-component response regulator